ncbi:hypothetical protein BO79DRAFT_162009 [Aspergillus costaricaensis CBS 115574]|uniref:Uncharacterized protein n=1 Tax=Aspergillus costaricaensis CBS 115574 TaxID=1448317 RepID=A0ACD1HZ46_9EURO|nr:hypothetical protein BO79DRAFT_162009 [Aspergillus costaricaensis CBS 115574]RAK83001.1 hypothetical protein BO79DRAFT_162009 [Aspergillus costaricaensis CBS 115574]
MNGSDTCREAVPYAKVALEGYAFTGAGRSGYLHTQHPVTGRVFVVRTDGCSSSTGQTGAQSDNGKGGRRRRVSFVLIGVAAYAGSGIVPPRACLGSFA